VLDVGNLLKTREFLLSEKFFSTRDKVIVKDHNQNPLGIFSSPVFAVGGKTYRLYDIGDQKNPVLTVKEKAVALRSTYTFFKGDKKDSNEVGKLKQELVSFGPRFWFEDPIGNKLFTMRGNLFGLDYKIFKEDNVVAEISKKLFKIRETYGVRMDQSLDDDTAVLVLGIVIMLHHEGEERH
jgi:uncharacterized protein YxjI